MIGRVGNPDGWCKAEMTVLGQTITLDGDVSGVQTLGVSSPMQPPSPPMPPVAPGNLLNFTVSSGVYAGPSTSIAP